MHEMVERNTYPGQQTLENIMNVKTLEEDHEKKTTEGDSTVTCVL